VVAIPVRVKLRAVAVRRPRTALVDHLVEDDFTRDVNNFEDITHLRNDLAPVLERNIIGALRPLMAARVDSRFVSP
jgi:hypothetical protein